MNLQLNLDELRFDPEKGTVVVVAQDAVNGKVLMVANADREALGRTIETGEMHYRSRSRGLWRKGATSGNVQRVVSLALDCDASDVPCAFNEREVSVGGNSRLVRVKCESAQYLVVLRQDWF